MGSTLGLEVWNEDEAGPFQTVPLTGSSWQPKEHPKRFPHEYERHGTAKMLTFFHPRTGEVRVKGVSSVTNVVLHQWVKEQLTAIMADLPEPTVQLSSEENRAIWESWREGLTVRVTLLASASSLTDAVDLGQSGWTQDA